MVQRQPTQLLPFLPPTCNTFTRLQVPCHALGQGLAHEGTQATSMQPVFGTAHRLRMGFVIVNGCGLGRESKEEYFMT